MPFLPKELPLTFGTRHVDRATFWFPLNFPRVGSVSILSLRKLLSNQTHPNCWSNSIPMALRPSRRTLKPNPGSEPHGCQAPAPGEDPTAAPTAGPRCWGAQGATPRAEEHWSWGHAVLPYTSIAQSRGRPTLQSLDPLLEYSPAGTRSKDFPCFPYASCFTMHSHHSSI